MVHDKHRKVEIATFHRFNASKHISMVHDKHCKVEIATFHRFHASWHISMVRNNHCKVEIAMFHRFYASRHISVVHGKQRKVEIAKFHPFYGHGQMSQGKNCQISSFLWSMTHITRQKLLWSFIIWWSITHIACLFYIIRKHPWWVSFQQKVKFLKSDHY